MGSKLIAFVGLFLCMSLLMISSQVAGTNVAEALNTVETSSKGAEKTDGVAVGDAKYPGGGYGGYSGGGYPGRGGPGGGRGGYCRYGCCGRSYYRGGCRCCTYAGEKPDAEPQAKPQN